MCHPGFTPSYLARSSVDSSGRHLMQQKSNITNDTAMTATVNFRQMAQYIGLAICTLIMRTAFWVSGILWYIVREIINGVFRVAIGVIVAILSVILFFGFILWLFTL